MKKFYKNFNFKRKRLDLLHLYEIMVLIMTESLNDICNATTLKTLNIHIKQIERIRKHFWDEITNC